MPASNRNETTSYRGHGKRTLRKLRRDAGYLSAKDFADAIGISASAYSQYERAAESPDSNIPLSAAWVIADALGVSIDLVVGREDINAFQEEELMIGRRLNALTPQDRERVLAFLSSFEHREEIRIATERANENAPQLLEPKNRQHNFC